MGRSETRRSFSELWQCVCARACIVLVAVCVCVHVLCWWRCVCMCYAGGGASGGHLCPAVPPQPLLWCPQQASELL